MNDIASSKRRLILLPTPLETRLLLASPAASEDESGIPEWIGADAVVDSCGCGLASAGVLAARHIARSAPDHVLLLGLAGSLDLDRAPVGTAVLGTHVTVQGLGAGQGPRHVSLEAMGFQALPGASRSTLALDAPCVGLLRGAMVSVAAASAGPEEARAVAAAHPDALIEDMETWSVALAAHLAGVPLTVLRAVSNPAGVRDKSAWRMDAAAEAMRTGLKTLFGILS